MKRFGNKFSDFDRRQKRTRLDVTDLDEKQERRDKWNKKRSFKKKNSFEDDSFNDND